MNHMPYANCILQILGRGALQRNPSQDVPVKSCASGRRRAPKFPVMTATGKAAVRQTCAASAMVRSGYSRHGLNGYASSQAAE